MEEFVPETRCDVKGCARTAPYKCPRCLIFYCSVTCYRQHSDNCVRAFSSESTANLRRFKVSEEERKRFNILLQSIRNDESKNVDHFEESYVPPATTHSLSDSESHERGENDAAVMLEKLMEQLSDDGKDALFTVLHKAMLEESNTHRSIPTTQTKIVSDEESNEGDAGDDIEFSKNTDTSNRLIQNAETLKDCTADGLSLRHRRAQSGQRLAKQKDIQIEEDVADVLQSLLDELDDGVISYDEALSRLPKSLAEEFESRMRDGRFGDLVTVWQPWWSSINVTSDEGNNIVDDLPELPHEHMLAIPVASARKIASRNDVLNGICNVLVAYCFVLRSMNGDWRNDCITSGRRLWQTSPVLASNDRPNGINDSIMSAYTAILSETRESATIAVQVVRDTAVLLGGCADWIARALFDSANLLQVASDDTECQQRKEVRLRVKKLHFFTAWAIGEEYGSFTSAARMVSTLAETLDGASPESSIAQRVKGLLN